MGQKVHPIGFRLGIYRTWTSRWFAESKNYANTLLLDLKIRKFLKKSLERAELSDIEVEISGDIVKVILHTARPGSVIGKRGQGIEDLRRQLAAHIGLRSVDISVQEVKQAELNATLVAESIARQLERRSSFKRAMKRAAQTTMRSGAKGIKIRCAGRLNGAEIARAEWTRMGSVPLHTLRSDIDYGFAEANTTYGIIGVKVWICRGEYRHIRK